MKMANSPHTDRRRNSQGSNPLDQHIATVKITLPTRDARATCRALGIDLPTGSPQVYRVSKRSESRSHALKTSQEQFLKGPIPLLWISRAFSLPGKAWHVGTVLWFWAGITRSKTVALTRKRLRHFGLHPETARQRLADLEMAGLVRIERRGKQCPSVTILDGEDIERPGSA
jgi:hypothetical protein